LLVRIAVMIEGQEDQTWDDWLALADACERLGFEALFRSDHYLSVDGMRDRGSLDAWGTVCALGAVTEHVRLGTLVSPATFRHPSVLAKSVVTADHISRGRVEVGIGTGWLEAEHIAYGFPFPQIGTRMDRLAEQLEIITRSWAPGPFSFHGEHWQVEDLDALPKPVQRPHPPLIMGGSAGPRSAALAARFAGEYNVVHVDPPTAAMRRARLDEACRATGRDPSTLTFSLMNGFVIGADEAALRDHGRRIAEWQGTTDDLDSLAERWIVGTPERFVARLREYADAGVERVMLQHHLYRDLRPLELVAAEVMPELRRPARRASSAGNL
jgi:F420-dependent oxidoreductase-like protein